MIVVATGAAEAKPGSYGYGRDVSPAVDALADDSVRFQRAYSVAPWTQPSLATM